MEYLKEKKKKGMELLSDVVIIRNATTTTKMGGYETRDFFSFSKDISQ